MKKIALIIVFIFISCDSKITYPVNGIILEVNNNNRKILIKHDEIPGFMMAMTMSFNVQENEDLDKYTPGDSVHFNLIIDSNQSYANDFKIITNINLEEHFIDDFLDEDPYDQLEMGTYMSDGTFLSVDSTEISLSDFEGNYIFLSYIFTRCPMPNMCPAVLVKNQYLSEKLIDKNIQFINISFDYIYDTPSILKNKYKKLISRFNNMTFLSSYGSLSDLNAISKETGISFWGIKENDIGHTMRSVLISPEGKLLSAYEGVDWIAKDEEKNILNFLALNNK